MKRGVSIRELYGKHFVSQQKIQRIMKPLENNLNREFKNRASYRSMTIRNYHNFAKSFREVASNNEKNKKTVALLRDSFKKARKRSLPLPRMQKARELIFSGSIAGTKIPPYDYPWSWSAWSGNPPSLSASADNNGGNMSLNAFTADSGSSSMSARAAVGSFFYPMVENGTLQIWSNPSFNDAWGTWSVLDSSGADGWIGLYVFSTDLAGGSYNTIIDQQINLYNDSGWAAFKDNFQQGSNSGYPLYAQFQVDNNHYYYLWVWCGVDCYADGWGSPFWGSAALSNLNVSVPSITWEIG